MSEETKRGPGRPAAAPKTEAPVMVKSEKVLAKTVLLGIGVDLLGSAMSLNTKKGNELEITPLGVKATSIRSKRVVIIPWSNIRGVELL